MSTRCHCFVALSLYLATTCHAGEPQVLLPRQVTPQSAEQTVGKLSPLDHLRLAAEQLEATGMADEAAKLRKAAERISRRVTSERDELARQISELQDRSNQLRQLTGKPDKILCRCQFLELSSKAAAEFAAAVQPASSSTGPRKAIAPGISVYKNAEEAIGRLKASGQVTVLASPQIVTEPGRAATATSGGEFPILVPAGGDRTSVEWRRFGASCKVVPRLLGTERVQLEFNPEIAQRDFKNAVKFNGQTIPGLATRRVNTRVEMNLGETLVVSLVSNPQNKSDDSVLPYLKSVVQWASAERETESTESTVTLFIVTPVAAE